MVRLSQVWGKVITKTFFLLSLQNKKISCYLDRKTQKIDDLIEKIKVKTKLLKEKKSSLINQCVTKGLEPNIKMKDSGIEWIEEIPEDWELIRLSIYQT